MRAAFSFVGRDNGFDLLTFLLLAFRGTIEEAIFVGLGLCLLAAR